MPRPPRTIRRILFAAGGSAPAGRNPRTAFAKRRSGAWANPADSRARVERRWRGEAKEEEAEEEGWRGGGAVGWQGRRRAPGHAECRRPGCGCAAPRPQGCAALLACPIARPFGRPCTAPGAWVERPPPRGDRAPSPLAHGIFRPLARRPGAPLTARILAIGPRAGPARAGPGRAVRTRPLPPRPACPLPTRQPPPAPPPGSAARAFFRRAPPPVGLN